MKVKKNKNSADTRKDFEILGAPPWHHQGEHQKFKSLE
jgi:hypothetical protein